MVVIPVHGRAVEKWCRACLTLVPVPLARPPLLFPPRLRLPRFPPPQGPHRLLLMPCSSRWTTMNRFESSTALNPSYTYRRSEGGVVVVGHWDGRGRESPRYLVVVVVVVEGTVVVRVVGRSSRKAVYHPSRPPRCFLLPLLLPYPRWRRRIAFPAPPSPRHTRVKRRHQAWHRPRHRPVCPPRLPR